MSKRELLAFKDALVVRNVLARVVDARQFPTEKALHTYLQEHPKADKSKHSVKGDKDETEEEGNARRKNIQEGKRPESKDETEAEGNARRKKIEQTKKLEDSSNKTKEKKKKDKEKKEFKDETEEEGNARRERIKNKQPAAPFKDETEEEGNARRKKMKHAALVQNVVLRVADEHEAMEFNSPEAMQKYLDAHYNAGLHELDEMKKKQPKYAGRV